MTTYSQRAPFYNAISTAEEVRSSAIGERERYETLCRLREEAADTDGILLPFKHKDVRLTSPHLVHSHRQALEIGRKFNLLGVPDLAVELVGHLQSVLVHPVYRGRKAWGNVRAQGRIIFTIEFHVCRCSFRRIDEGKPIPLVRPDLKHKDRVHRLARA